MSTLNLMKLKKLFMPLQVCTVAEKTFDEAEATKEDKPVFLFFDSPYQISKIIGEFCGNYYWMRHKLLFVKAWFQNVYGAWRNFRSWEMAWNSSYRLA
ncbi:hypothetical protein [Coxiella-like endosymbiont of Rhipicephalus sanguineus]|uniref:hypothetical protein n=1 Tax=Coxiella-like endosymbiont of Rhipicephalus sanguineus TaxID=1955402 RepID=UPI00203B79CF|nr:hypothetical protein [Coxiella-like endosymbiont of Rhipicephalus sanguineus]